MDDPAFFLDSFLPDSKTPELSEFSDSLSLLEQNPSTGTPLATPSLPTLASPTNLDDDPSTFALSDSELSSLLNDPNPAVPDTTKQEINEDDANSPAPSSCSTDNDNEVLIPAKRRRSTINNNSTTNEYPPPSSPVTSSAGSVHDASSGCSDCDHARNNLVQGVSRKELEQRLKLSAEENGRLRKRVADLMQENRGLRAHVEQLGQAAMAMQAALQNGGVGVHMDVMKKTDDVEKNAKQEDDGGMMVGLATVSKEMAKQLGGMVVIGGKEKKRRRKKVGTAMACVMVVMAAMVGIPDYFSDGKGLLALPGSTIAGWDEKGLVPLRRRDEGLPRVPRLCEYVERPSEKKAIAGLGDEAEIKVVDERVGKQVERQSSGSLFVKMDDEDERKAMRQENSDTEDESLEEKEHGEQYSYVLCKDSVKALASVRSCMKAEQDGKACPKDNVISLIMPMPALKVDGEDENGTRFDETTTLTEVECHISSVKKLIPKKPSAAVQGRIIAST